MPHVSRRTIIQTAAIVPFQAVRGSAQNSTIKIGLIGAGSRGTYTGSIIAKDPRVKMTAICDVVDQHIENARAKIGATDAKAYKDFQDVLSSDVDAVMIATPVWLHPRMVNLLQLTASIALRPDRHPPLKPSLRRWT